MRNGSRYTLWRGDSLSNANAVVRRVVPDLDEPAVVRRRICIGSASARDAAERRLDVGRLERVAREHVLDVHQQQLLVLLLVVQAELDERGERRATRRRRNGR